MIWLQVGFSLKHGHSVFSFLGNTSEPFLAVSRCWKEDCVRPKAAILYSRCVRGQRASEPSLAPDKNVSGTVLNLGWIGTLGACCAAEHGFEVVDCLFHVVFRVTLNLCRFRFLKNRDLDFLAIFSNLSGIESSRNWKRNHFLTYTSSFHKLEEIIATHDSWFWGFDKALGNTFKIRFLLSNSRQTWTGCFSPRLPFVFAFQVARRIVASDCFCAKGRKEDWRRNERANTNFLSVIPSLPPTRCRSHRVQGSAKEWSLGCVIPASSCRGGAFFAT